MKRSRRRGKEVLLSALLLASLGFPALPSSGGDEATDLGASRLGLAEAVRTALAGNPMMRQAKAGAALAQARRSEAAAGWFPRAELSSTFTRGNNPVFVFGSLLEQARFTADHFAVDALNDPAPANNLRTAATLQVPVFDQFQTSSRVEQARLGQDQAGQHGRLTEQRLRFEAVRAYFGVVLAESRERVARQAVESVEADVKRVRDLHEVGTVVRSDLLGAEVQLSEFRQEEITAAGDAAVAQAALDLVLGVAPGGHRHDLSGTLSERPFRVRPEAELIETAVANRPEYAGASSSVRVAQEGVRMATGQYLPRLDAFATYGGSGTSLSVDSTDWTVGARLSYDLLDLGRGARRDQAQATVSAAMAERELAGNRIGLEVVQANRHFVSAGARLKVAAGASGQAAEALRIVQDRYQAGLTTITEVLRAQTAQLRAHLNELAARYDTYVGYAEVLLATGTLNDVAAFDP